MPDCWRWEGSEEEASVGWLPTLLVKVIRYFVMTLHSPSSSIVRRPNEICVSWSRRGRRFITKVRGHWESGYIPSPYCLKGSFKHVHVWDLTWDSVHLRNVPSDVTCVSAHNSQPTVSTCVDCFLCDLQYKILVGPHNNRRGTTLPCHV